MSGWLKVYRSLADHWLWQDKPFSKGQAWIDLLLLVNHTPKKALIDGTLQEIDRGQTITSIRKLCDRWGWSNTKVRRFLKMLEDDGMVNVKSDSKKTVINIVNYSVFQDSETEKTTVKRQQDDTETSQKHTNKNEKNVKNEKKCSRARFVPPSYEQVSSYCQERGNDVDAQRFLDFYQSKGWMVGKNKMKDWKAAVRSWERREGGKKKEPEKLHNFTKRDYDFDELERQLMEKQMREV